MLPDLIELRARPDALHLFQGHSLLITAQDGVVRGRDGQGLYEQNTRLLSHWEHQINGKGLKFVAASSVDAYSMLAYYLAADVLEEVPGLKAEEPGLALRVSRFLGKGMHEDVDLENYTQTTVHCTLAWRIEADFADVNEALAGKRQQEATVESTWRRTDRSGELLLHYTRPKLDRAVVIRFPNGSGGPSWHEGMVTYDVVLGPQEQQHFCISIEPVLDGRHDRPIYGCYAFHSNSTERDQLRHRLLDSATRLRTSNATVQNAWDHAVGDLASLSLYDGGWPEVLTPAAGIPAYQALFGRDALTAAWQAAMVEPVLMEATLAATSRYQGHKRDDFYDEQPGRIVQQVNFGPLASLGLNPFRHYYGDYVAPAGFLIILSQHFAWTGDTRVLRRFAGIADRALDWIDGAADLDGDGFLEFETRSPVGQKNQGWKDSSMAMVYEDGRGVPNPIAGGELQAYTYVAKQQYALALAFGLHQFRRARSLLGEAADLKRRFNEAFWMPAEGTLASALDAEKRQVRTVDSNAGHCLATGIVDQRYAPAVARRLMAPDMFSGWGIRTLSSEHPAFNPLSYQLGAVWPIVSATIAFGFKQYGFSRMATDLAKATFDLAALFPHQRLPEVVGGYQRDAAHPHPGIYPQAQLPQAWSAGAIPQLIQAMLALWPVAPLKLLLIDPELPEWLPDLTLSNLRVGNARLRIRFHREADGSTAWKILEKRGTVLVIQQAAGADQRATPWQRGAGLLDSLLPWRH